MEININRLIKNLSELSSTNAKIELLKTCKSSDLTKRVLQMTYDKVLFTYGCTLGSVLKYEVGVVDLTQRSTLSDALDLLSDTICTRVVTGHEALDRIKRLWLSLCEDDRFVIERVLDRNAQCGVGRTQINKVFPGLITKPVYMRCGTFNSKTRKKIKYPAIVQKKADGTYREFTVQNGTVSARSRSGESYEYPALFEALKSTPSGVYVGELTVKGCDNRATSNGMLDSNDVPHGQILLELWDFVLLEEYKNSADKSTKVKNKTTYLERLNTLKSIVFGVDSNSIQVIESHVVHSEKHARTQVSEWMVSGFEGGVLKNVQGVFRDGTSLDQLKLKICISAEMRCSGFSPGSVGTKREGKVGALEFKNDDGTIRGKCSGFSDKELNIMTNSPDKYLGKIIEVEFNDLTQARGNDYWSLSHPRFVELREDKSETDTFDRVVELRDMAVLLK